MVNYIIKICGIRDSEMAKQAALAGANLIGIVFHPLSARYVSLETAILIADAARNAGITPVAVFVDHTNVQMLRICEATNIDIVQLHGVIARAHHYLLPDTYQRIYVQPVSENGQIQTDVGFRYLDSQRDFVLIDHPIPGQGNVINRQKFCYKLPFPWILAGGLSPYNVQEAINTLQPNGVDVSTGVESSKGKKDSVLLQKFVSLVRGLHHVG